MCNVLKHVPVCARSHRKYELATSADPKKRILAGKLLTEGSSWILSAGPLTLSFQASRGLIHVINHLAVVRDYKISLVKTYHRLLCKSSEAGPQTPSTPETFNDRIGGGGPFS